MVTATMFISVASIVLCILMGISMGKMNEQIERLEKKYDKLTENTLYKIERRN